MITIETIRMNYFKIPRHRELLDKTIPLIKEVFGYTNEEIEGFKEKIFYPPLAIGITLDQAKLAVQPFLDYGAEIMLLINEYDDNWEITKCGSWEDLGLTRQTPKSRYYDEPVIYRNQLVDPYNPPRWVSNWTGGVTFKPTPPQPTRPTIACPACGSTNTRKIGGIERGVSVLTLGLMSRKINKSFKCNKCGYTF